MNYQNNNDLYYNPVTIIQTNHWAKETKSILNSKNRSNPLIITSKGNNNRIIINKYFKNITIIDNVPSNPTIQYCDQELKKIQVNNFDSIIAIGGGSVMDAAKVFLAGLNLKNKSTTELIKFKGIFKKNIQSIFLPTTHGTASEVTMWGTVWDMKNKKKYSIANPELYPTYAILDYQLTESLPVNLSITTLMDALSHSLESIWNKNRSSKTIEYAIDAITLIVNNTQNIEKHKISKENRKNLLYSSTLAGLAFSNTKTAVAHSISYPLTIYYNIPHGIASSMTLVPLLILSNNKIQNELEKIYKRLNINNISEFIDKIKSIYNNQISYRLRDWGVDKKDIPLLVEKCYTKDRIENYIVDISEKDILEILEKIY